jgi:hypothetical protein
MTTGVIFQDVRRDMVATCLSSAKTTADDPTCQNRGSSANIKPFFSQGVRRKPSGNDSLLLTHAIGSVKQDREVRQTADNASTRGKTRRSCERENFACVIRPALSLSLSLSLSLWTPTRLRCLFQDAFTYHSDIAKGGEGASTAARMSACHLLLCTSRCRVSKDSRLEVGSTER